MATVISIISLIATVSQIILFFKVWDMCNDIRAMRQQTVPQNDKKKRLCNLDYYSSGDNHYLVGGRLFYG